MNGEFSKKIVALVIMLNVIFTASVFACFWHTGNEPDTLIVSFFAFTTGELWMLSKIRRSKLERDNYDLTGENGEDDISER